MEDKPLTLGPLKADVAEEKAEEKETGKEDKKKPKKKETPKGPFTYSFSYWGR
jgi:hypothetical protein